MPILTKPGDIMAINRIKKERDFVILDIAMLRNPKLSLKAKGLLAFILSRPDDWVFTIRGLAHFCRDGPDSVRSAVKELEKEGYIVRRRKRKKGKYQEMEYDIYEKPMQDFTAQVSPKKESTIEEKASIPNMELPSIDVPIIDSTHYPSINQQETERLIRKQIEYEIMCQRYDYRQLDNLVSLMVEVLQCKSAVISVSRDKEYPVEYVRACIRKIGPMHIEQIMETLLTNRPEIRNVRGYLLSMLINTANTLEICAWYGEENRL